MQLRLPDAAKQVGLHRSSLFRAIRAGRLSATRTEGGDYLIDTSELFRAYPPKVEPSQPNASDASGCVEPRATSPATEINELRLRIATLETELRAQRDLITRLDRDKADLQGDRDAWKGQATQLALAPPVRRSWRWPFRRQAE